MNMKVADKDGVMRARWVLAWKSTGKAKAFCVLEFQDADSTEVPRDSPMISQCVASNQVKLASGDIMTVFLSRDEEHRNIFILPPDDVRDILRLSPESMLRLRKAVSGLVNSKEKWRDPLKRSLLNHVSTSGALDLCAFVLVKQKQIRGVTGLHVEDLLGGGKVFDKKVLEVKNEFDFGAWDAAVMGFTKRQLT